jgi:hypothetical protein
LQYEKVYGIDLLFGLFPADDMEKDSWNIVSCFFTKRVQLLYPKKFQRQIKRDKTISKLGTKAAIFEQTVAIQNNPRIEKTIINQGFNPLLQTSTKYSMFPHMTYMFTTKR